MPNWKKVITSGSDAALNSLVAPSITGSLLGTASYATQALSSSYAVTSSLPLLGIITASSNMNQITFTKGDGSTFNLLLSTGSVASASYSATASYVLPLVQDVQLTGSLLISGAIQFDTNSSPTMNPGVLAWNAGEGTLQFGLAGGNVDYNVSEQLYQYVFNAEATTLTKGTIVYVSGSQGGRIAVKRADWSAEQGSAGTLGFVAENITSGAEGWVMTEGSLRGVDTSAFTGGQLIFLGDDGAYTATIPTAPSHSVRLGYAQKINATTGIIYVKIDNGYEIDELHDVRISNKQDGDLLVWNSGSRVWNNTKQLTGSYSITGSLIISSSGATNEFQVGDNKLFVSASGRVGIGTSSPSSSLHVNSQAQPSTGESIARFTVSDADGVLAITNNGTADGAYQPAIVAQQASTINTTGFLLRSQIGNDTGGSYAMIFEARSGSSSVVSTRPLFQWRNNTTPYMVMDATGSVGIGITSPTSKLHINNTGAGNSFLVEDSTNPDASPFIIDTAGLVGIGSLNPSSKLSVTPSNGVDGIFIDASPVFPEQSGRMMFGSVTTSSNTPMIYATSGSLGFYTGGTPNVSSGTAKLAISSSGNVGIGTFNPTLATLQVNGNVYATSFTGSLFGTASYATTASYALTASYVNGSITKTNIALSGSFSGNPRKATITYTTAFPDTNYSVILTGEDSRIYTVENKTTTGFTINTNSSINLTGNVYWNATSYGEFRS